MEYNLWVYVASACVGFLVAFVNSIAGGGSIFSLPFLMSLGLTGLEANATNRVPLIVGILGSVGRFKREGLFPKKVVVISR